MNQVEFIIEADEPALFFADKRTAEHYLEAVDVETGVYPIAFDRRGLVYEVTPFDNRAELIPNSAGIYDVPRLKDLLRSFLVAAKVELSSSDSLEELLEKCAPYMSG